ncbi:MAG: multidrug effflux MFS transporter [Legionellales bacterium]|nr:multidrug effflux MFS transporter [Legionellales bacterium]
MPQQFITFREFKLMSLTVLLAICGSLGVDIHLASLPHIMIYLHTTRAHMQQSVTLFILGVGLSMLIYGPLSDKIGRKPVVIFGLCLAAIASFSAAFSQSIISFLILRILQGIGSGVCWGLGRIIAADVMQGERLAAIGSYFTLFLSLSPLLAPALGGYVQHAFGWQANFILLGSIILLALLVFMLFFEETNQHKRPEAFSLFPLVKTYFSFFQNRLFVGCALLTGIAMSASILYTTISSFIFQDQFHTTPIVFGWLTAVVGAAGIIGKLISPFFMLRLKNQKTLFIGIVLLLSSGIFLSLFTFSGHISIPTVLIGVSIAILALVFIGSITMSMALSPFHNKRGSAGALFGSFQLLVSFTFSAIVASFPHLGTNTLAGAFVVLGLLGFICYFSLVRNTQ